MEDRYLLRRATLDPQVMVPITPERYSALCSARSTLIDAGAFEQRYEILLGNYIAFETFCAEWSLRSDIEMDHRYETWAMVILEGNRHVMNLLSAARSYADHVVRDFQHLSLSPSFKDQATSFMRAAYDHSLAYRIVCALRNYVQHRAAPIHVVSQGRGTSRAELMSVYCHKARLEEDGDFKASVLAEVEAKIDLRKTIREYMHEVSCIHLDLRKHADGACDEARAIFKAAIAEFVAAQDKEEQGTSGIGLTACRENKGEFVDAHPILLAWDDVRVLLAEKNRYTLKV